MAPFLINVLKIKYVAYYSLTLYKSIYLTKVLLCLKLKTEKK